MAQTPQTDDDANRKRMDPKRPDTAGDGPVQSRRTADRTDPDKQIAQDRQQSTGVSTGQS